MKIGVGIGLPFSGKAGIPQPPSAPANISAPVIPQWCFVYTEVECDPGIWSGYPSPAFTYQWFWAPSTDIAGATGKTYVVQPSDLGKTLRCKVTATNTEGSAGPVNSNPSNQVTYQPAPPTATAAPVISGYPHPDHQLTCSEGIWAAYPPITSYTYAWYDDGTLVGTGPTYDVTISDLGQHLYCTVTATNDAGSTSKNSLPIEIVEASSVAEDLLGDYTDGVAGSFIDHGMPSENWLGSMQIKDTVTPTNNFLTDRSKLITDKFTFAGQSLRMVEDQDGLIKYGNHNLVPKSNSMWTWSIAGAGQAVSNDLSVTDALGGNRTALFIESASVGSQGIRLNAGWAAVAGSKYRIIARVKKRDRKYAAFWVWSATNTAIGVAIDLDTLAFVTAQGVSAAANRGFVEEEDGWVKFWGEVDAVNTTTAPIHVGPLDDTLTDQYQGDGASGIWIFGLEIKTLPCQFADEYVGTDASPVFMPRIFYEGGVRKGMLAEPQATNIISKSNSPQSWIKNSNITAQDGQAIGPDGQMSLALITGTLGEARIYPTHSALTPDANYVYHCVAKYGNENGRYLYLRDFYAGRDTCFDLETNSVVSAPSGVTAWVEPAPNGLHRFCAAGANASTPAVNGEVFWTMSQVPDNPSTGLAGAELLIGWAQFESGLVPTSPIITGDSAVTRLSDMTTLDPAKYNSTSDDLTSYAEFFNIVQNDVGNVPDNVFSFGGWNRFYLSNGRPSYYGAPSQTTVNQKQNKGDRTKIAVAGDQSSRSLSANGLPVVTQADGVRALAGGIEDIIGVAYGIGTLNCPFVITEFLCVIERITDTALEELTVP